MHLRDEGVEQAKALKIDRAPGKDLANPVPECRSIRDCREVLDRQARCLACPFDAAQRDVESVERCPAHQAEDMALRLCRDTREPCDVVKHRTRDRD